MSPEPLEDDFTWVLRKALKGCNLAPTRAAGRAGLPVAAVLALSRGDFCAATARQLAPVLDLDPAAFAALPEYQPHAGLPAGLTRLAFTFGGGTVNAWLARRGDHALLIDAGADPAALRDALTDHAGLRPVVLVTHAHHDHTGGLPALRGRAAALHAPAGAHLPGATALTVGSTVAAGSLTARAIDLDGHWPGQLGFVIDGLDAPVCAVGDALFAGSVGGTSGPAHHQIALDRIRRHLLTLPDATVLLPGHGPPTTVGLERRHNPFLAAARPPSHR
jgi:glyoxylase-like metal-dependent hydrolase (beta-lactamase superfamily II)